MTDDNWNPFSSEDDFNLENWFVQSKIHMSQIYAYFAEGLVDMNCRSFQSAYTLQQHPAILDLFPEYSVWAKGSIE